MEARIHHHLIGEQEDSRCEEGAANEKQKEILNRLAKHEDYKLMANPELDIDSCQPMYAK